jgi:uncharacterized protein (TIGR03435 family)
MADRPQALRRYLGRLFGLLLLLPSSMAAQAMPRFDVATIKLAKGPVTHSADPAVRGRAVFSTASTLSDLIQYAYDVRHDAIEGEPAWVKSQHYDLEARADGEDALTTVQAKQMMQSLLADRFQLVVHRESRERPVYFLIVGKSGRNSNRARLTPPEAPRPGPTRKAFTW